MLYKLAAILVSLPLTSGLAIAQTTGDIRGTVTDESGAPFPGVAVTITSNDLITGSREIRTNKSGVFRFPSLPIGTYAIEVRVPRFESVRVERVDVRINGTSNVPLTLTRAPSRPEFIDEITVMPRPESIDSTRLPATVFKDEMLEDLPTHRSVYDWFQIAPGMSAFSYGGNDRTVAFGSSQQSNSWRIDGVETSAPEVGTTWWDVNPDTIQEIEVLGVGAPAEFGNAMGAVFNVVTKKGGNDFHGGANVFFQADGITGKNEEIDGFAFERDLYRDVTAQLGGPLSRDRAWFYGAYSHQRDSSWQPGNDPVQNTPDRDWADRFDFKTTFRVNDRHEVGGLFHYEDRGLGLGSTKAVAPSAAYQERSDIFAWGANVTSIFSAATLFELRYAGWTSLGLHDSPTGSFDEPHIDFTPPGGGPPTLGGGVLYPWDYSTSSNQANARVTHYAQDFLSSQHEFKFGVQFARGTANLNQAIGPNASYKVSYYGYTYQYRQDPYQYGGSSRDLGLFVDDTINVGGRLTLNLGVRLDFNRGSIPDYERLEPGTPSIAESNNARATGEQIPGISNLVRWNLISPRLGFTFQPGDSGRSAVKGFFGVHYDQNVIGNWDAPPPGRAPFQIYAQDPLTGAFDKLVFEITSEDVAFHPNLRPPRSLQFTLGYEHQIDENTTVGTHYTYKATKDLIGWEILDGEYEPFPFTDPFTGEETNLLDTVAQPTLRKGNDPGNFPGAEVLDYEQDYHGIVFRVDRRFSDAWSLQGSYTLSRSEGLTPTPLFQDQNDPLYGNPRGSDPNTYFNAYQRLQGDRPHMFRLQSVFQLPRDVILSTSVNIESGRPFNRQVQVFGLNQGSQSVILESAGSREGLRHPSAAVVDVLIGKRLYAGGVQLRLDGQIYNLLNSNATLSLESQTLQSADDVFVPNSWVRPRRLMIRLGFIF